MKKWLACLLSVMIIFTSAVPGTGVAADETIGVAESTVATPAPEPTPEPTPEATPEPAAAPAETPIPEAEPESTPEAEITPAPTAAPEATPDATTEPSPEPLINRAAEEETKAFDITATTSLGPMGGELYSGSRFDYTIGYSIPPVEGEGDKNYNDGRIEVVLPENVTPVVDELGNPLVLGDDVNTVSYLSANRKLTVFLNTGLVAGNAKTVNVLLQTANFKMADGTVVKLDPVFTARADSRTAKGKIQEDQKPIITVRADDGWMVTKTAGPVKIGEDSYTVDYQVVVETTAGGSPADYNRFGRLELESYALRDTLPTGVVEGGNATAVTGLKMDDAPLSEDDYNLLYDTDGRVTGLEIRAIGKAGTGMDYVKAGTPATTTYTYTVTYPRNPYITPSNLQLVKYDLTNTAQIDYTLYTKGAQSDASQAVVTVGEKEKPGAGYDLTAVKKVNIGGESYVFGGQKGAVSFGLYLDAGCNQIAPNKDGSALAGTPTGIDENGRVTFKDLRPGTYYLKETVSPGAGLEGLGAAIPVTVGVGGANSQNEAVTEKIDLFTLGVLNQTRELGIVEFTKYGKDSSGNVGPLADCAFTLTGKTDPSKVYTARSDENGLVTFMFVPAGDYILKETAAPSDEYDAGLAKEYEIQVQANQKVTPILETIDGVSGFFNVSPKGRFSLEKTDSADPSVKLQGAEFEVYGPYGASVTELPEGAAPVENARLATGSDGAAVSVPLNAGYYFIKEVKAPSGYSVTEQVFRVEVAANTVTPLGSTVTNEKKYSFTINKTGLTQDAYPEPLYGVTFDIFGADGTTKIATLTTKRDATGNAVTDELLLDRGTYYYQETSVPEGYAKKDEKVPFTIPLEGGAQLKVENHSSYGRLKIIKTDALDGVQFLSGAVFGIYTDAECKNQADQVTTNASGEAVSKLLPGADYYVKELQAPEGFVLSDDIQKITVSDEKVALYTVQNQPLRQIEVVKKDSHTGETLEGVEFGLYRDASASDLAAKAVTGAEGTAVFKGLMPNREYYLKETKALDGYVPADGITTVTTTDRMTELTLENQRFAKLRIRKTARMDGADVNMEDAVFNLYPFKGEGYDYTDETPAAVLTTDAQGEAWADGLTPGTYYLVEASTGAAEGIYDLMTPRTVTLEAGLNQGPGYGEALEELTDNTLNGKLEIEKLGNNAAGDSQKPLNAAFELYTDPDCTVHAYYVGGTTPVALLTDENGKALSGWLRPGVYYLKETMVAGDYTVDPAPKEVVIGAAATTGLTGAGALVNLEKGRIQIAKKAAFQISGKTEDIEYDLAGAKFALYKKTGDTIADDIKNGPAGEIDMTAGSKGISDYLDAGAYWVVETVFPKNYTHDPDTMAPVEIGGNTCYYLKNPVTVGSGETSAEINVKNRTEKGRLKIYKKAFNAAGPLLDGANFEVYRQDENGDVTIQVDGTAYRVTKVKVSASTDAGGSILQTGTAEPGGAVTVDIEPGVYFVKETDTSNIPGGPWYWYQEWTGPITVEKGQETQKEIYNYTMKGEGTKTDGKGAPLAGAVLGAFSDKDAAETMAAWITGQNLSYLNAHYAELDGTAQKVVDDYKANLEKESFLKTNGILQTAVSGADGKFAFNGLTPGGTFWVLELMAPAGYKIESTPYEVKVNADGDGFDGGLNIANKWLGSLEVYKYTLIGGEEYPVKAMPFAVYEAVPDENGTYEKDGQKYIRRGKVASGFTKADGKYTSVYLNEGTYIVEEVDDNALLQETVPTVDLNTEAPSYRIVTVRDGEVNGDYADKEGGFYNPSAVGRFLLKKTTDPVGNNTLNVPFLLEKKNGDGIYKTVKTYGNQGKFTVKTNGTNIYKSDYLPAGEYRITEQKVAGLTILTDPIEFEIQGGKLTGSENENTTVKVGVTKDQPLIIENDRQGSLSLRKIGVFGDKDSYTDAAGLNGVVFKLYKNSGNAADDCAGKAVATLTTKNGGNAAVNNIDAGDYWLVETSLGSANNGKYTLDGTPLAVTIKKNAATKLTGANSIKNITTYGKLKIKKADANDSSKGLKATFGIYTDAACTEQAKDINGKNAAITTVPTDGGLGLSGLIPAGEYYLKETELPEGYTFADGGAGEITVYGPYTVSSNQTADASGEPMLNRLKFSLTVNKTVKDSSVKLGGVTIALYGSQEDAIAGTNALASKTTAEGVGSVVFEGLTVQAGGKASYWYKETAVPQGYDLNENVYRVDIDYAAHSESPNIVKTIENDVLGRFSLKKVGGWQGVSDSAPQTVPLEGAGFSVYEVSGENIKHTDGAVPADTLTTDGNGTATSKQLEPGWYEVVETAAPEGYALMEHSRWVEVKNNGTDTSLVDSPVENIPDKGRFYLVKQDGKGNNIGDARGAQFRIEKYGADGWAPFNGGATITVPVDGYTSYVMDPGRYRLIETEPPKQNVTGGSVEFALDETPIEFEIEAGVTTKVNGDGVVQNDPKGTVELQKYGSPNAFTDEKEALAGARFELYTDNGGQKGALVEHSQKTTDASGLCRWEGLDPGTYWIQEVESDSASQAGYGINAAPLKVVAEAGKSVYDDLVSRAEMTDLADQGKLLITKKDMKTGAPLDGAVFAVYAGSGSGWDMSGPVDTVLVSGGRGLSKFLPAGVSGTRYKVVEIQAPGGYVLDGALAPVEKEVLLYPIHTPEAGENDGKNVVDFENRKRGDVTSFVSHIDKAVSDADEGPAGEVNAPESLLKEDYEARFTLSGYADGKNEVGAEVFTVTDNSLVLQYLEGAAYKEMEAEDYDYDITEVQILAASNQNSAEKVRANLYYQPDLAAKKSGTWIKFNAAPMEISSDQSIDLSGIGTNVAGVKVEYLNVQAGFKAGGIAFNVTFNNRAPYSTELDHEVRRIANQAQLEWKDRCADESGKVTSQNSAKLNSDEVYILVPAYENKLPQVSIVNEVVDKKKVYYSGDMVKYQITATNHVVSGQNESFKSPVISFRMPALTTVDESRNNNGFLVYRMAANGSKTLIPPSAYALSSVVTAAPLKAKGDDSYDESDTIDSTQYVFSFDEDLAPDESIVISFQGVVSYDPKLANNVSELVLPAYLSSTALVPKSMENPLGLSFGSYENKQKKHDNDLINGEVDETLQYLNETNTVTVSDSTSVSLVKSVGYKDENGNVVYMKPGQKASVNAADEVYYKLTVINNSSDKVQEARIIDILPFKGDSYVLPSGSAFTPRGTDIPSGAGYEPMVLLSAAGESDNVSFYYTDRDFSSRSTGETGAGGVLGSLYYRTSDFQSTGWAPGYDQSATALGMSVNFNGDTLDPGESYNIYLTMKTPGYTADKIGDYLNKVMNNSAALSVIRQGDENAAIPNNFRVEPNKVTAQVKLPTGSIGDYAWYDVNNNGLQDPGEPAAQGVSVTLKKNTYTLNIDGDVRKTTSVAGTAVTDQNGYYRFDNLACQYLKAGAAEGSADPSDYVGGEYYDYTLQFSIPGGYSAALRYAGEDGALDSNINASGNTGAVVLKVVREGNSLRGQTDLTIDAGFVKPYSLGDFVWLDLNNNGLQDPGEQGVPGVPIFLYRVGGPQGEVNEAEGYLMRTVTDENGLYKFENLIEGYYVVEFDISNLRKSDGYTYSYDFTKTTESALGVDSDARHPVDAAGRIRRTDVIDLSEAALRAAGLSGDYDPRWDAGLTVSSALGGFCFDDADYNNIHTLNIPLPGTRVELYTVKNGFREETPLASAVVGLDGKYYFDHLVFDGNTQDYQLRFIFPEGYTGVDGNVGSDNSADSDVLYSPGSGRREGFTEVITLRKDTVDTTWDAGARKYGVIGDYVWNDENKDGRQDQGETPVPGLRVVLQSKTGGGDWQYLAETVTDDKGLYRFENLKGGSHYGIEYRVVFVTDRKTEVTACQQPGVGEDENSDAIGTYLDGIVPGSVQGGYVTRSITLGYGQEDLTWDAGIVKKLSSVGDFVWYDTDYNGIQAESDKGVPNVPVAIEHSDTGDGGWKYYASTVTDAGGKYLFENLPAGYYRLRFQVPDGYTVTKYDQTPDAEKDSDAMIRSEQRWYYTQSFYLAAGVTDLSWDAGIYKPKVREETEYIYTNGGKNNQSPIRTAGSKQTGDASGTGPALLALILSGAAAWMLKRGKKRPHK